MGIKDLWTILGPYADKKPLSALENQTVAIDLSCWICESQNVVDYSVYAKMHLRNLFFRANYFLLNDIRPIFVLEGEAPELKSKVLESRRNVQFRGAPIRRIHATKSSSNPSRSRFRRVLKECKKMLNLMGIECLQAVGEAEATCAYLNRKKIVDGCVTQDSDCFAYGADTVYRNFSLSSSNKIKSCDGLVEVYNLKDMRRHFNDFGQNKIIAFALLCGCDYDDGVSGAGKDSVLKFLNQHTDATILNRIRSWNTQPEVFDNLEMKLNEKLFCKLCGHRFFNGKSSHRKDGCSDCGTLKECKETNKHKEFYTNGKNEIQIRKKALTKANFPSEKLISEFLEEKDTITKQIANLKFQWKCPNLIKFIEFAAIHLEWDELYAFEKILPLVTRWHLLNPKNRDVNNFVPEAKTIQKKRQQKGKNCYQVLWHDPKNYYSQVISDIRENAKEEHGNEYVVNFDNVWVTIESSDLMESVYPKLVVEFLKSKSKHVIKKRKSNDEFEDNNREKRPKSITFIDLEDSVELEAEKSFFFEENFESKVDLFEKSCDKIILLSSDDDEGNE